MSGARRLIYSRRALKGDYLRAGAGAAACLFILALAPALGITFWIMAAGAGFFVLFGLTTLFKQRLAFELDAAGVTRCLAVAGGKVLRSPALEFDRIDRLKLTYYGARRQRLREAGVVELVLRAGESRLTVDHTLEDFDDLVLAALKAARRRNLLLDNATSANLARLGYE